MIKIYHNPRCRKSRAGLDYLEKKGVEFEVVDYLKNPLSEQEIDALIKSTGHEAEELVRKQEDYFKQNLKGKSLTREQWVKEIANNPKLLQRPIVHDGNKSVLANPPENINELI